MSFWKNVVNELDYQGKTRKWLASKAEFDVSTIGTGLKRDGIPQADLAIKISKALNVSVEYLVMHTSKSKEMNEKEEFINDVRLYRKYAKLIALLEAVPSEKQKPIQNAVELLLSATM